MDAPRDDAPGDDAPGDDAPRGPRAASDGAVGEGAAVGARPWRENRWQLPDPAVADEHGIVGIGADLAPPTVLAAYRRGLFPMHLDGLLAWWSPDPRAVIPLDTFRPSRSLRRSRRRFEIRLDTRFADVMRACADPHRPHGWINDEMLDAYTELHRLGWAHSVETWHDGALAGGLYGIRIGGFFAGESMFHRVTDASKVALWATVDLLRLDGATLFDVQWQSDHLRSLGAVEVPRTRYLKLLAAAVGPE